MAYGSFLGAIRHHGPIPWDNDIDIYVPESDLPIFLSLMKKELPDKYWVDYRDDKKHPRAFPRIGLSGYETDWLHIDVYRLGGFPTNKFEYKIFTWYSKFLKLIWKSKTLDIDFYYPDRKRRIVSKLIKLLTCWIPLNLVLKCIDRQANRIPFDKAKIVASPLTTMSPKRMHDRRIFDESILVDYADFKVRVPKNYEQYLETQFGNWKEFPPEEVRNKEMVKISEVRKLRGGK